MKQTTIQVHFIRKSRFHSHKDKTQFSLLRIVIEDSGLKMDFETKIWNLPKTEKDAIMFFQDKGLLPTTKQCVNGHNLTLYSYGKEDYPISFIIEETILIRIFDRNIEFQLDSLKSNSKCPSSGLELFYPSRYLCIIQNKLNKWS